MTDARHLACAIAEFAAESESLLEFRQATLEFLQKVVGFDLGSMQSTTSNTSVGWGYPFDNAALTDSIAQTAGQYSLEEIRRMVIAQTATTDEVFSRPREQELSIFSEHFRPLGMRTEITCMWRGRTEIAGFIFARAAGGFSEGDRRILDSLQPLIATAEVLFARADKSSVGAWCEAHALTPSQSKVASLVARGLTNSEVGRVLGCSEFTVRNHLAAVFRLVGVTTRAELVFEALSPAEQGKLGVFQRWSQRVRAACEQGPPEPSAIL